MKLDLEEGARLLAISDANPIEGRGCGSTCDHMRLEGWLVDNAAALLQAAMEAADLERRLAAVEAERDALRAERDDEKSLRVMREASLVAANGYYASACARAEQAEAKLERMQAWAADRRDRAAKLESALAEARAKHAEDVRLHCQATVGMNVALAEARKDAERLAMVMCNEAVRRALMDEYHTFSTHPGDIFAAIDAAKGGGES